MHKRGIFKYFLWIFRNEHAESYWDFKRKYYSQAWTRAPPYMVGILMGWFLHKTKRTQLYFSRVSNLCNVPSKMSVI